MICHSSSNGCSSLVPVTSKGNLFDEEMWNIEKEMDFMRRRMEDEMRRFL